MNTKNLGMRLLCFAIGITLNAFGISLTTIGDLGTSSISSVPYVASLALPRISFGLATFIWNVLFVATEILLLRHRFHLVQLLQLAACLLFASMIDVGMAIFGFIHPVAIWQQLLCVFAGCVMLAFGIVIEVSPNLIMAPGEGIVRAFAIVTRGRYGTVKAFFDTTLIIMGAMLSLICFHALRGVGIGTIISALIVGPIINIINKAFRFPDRIRRLAPTETDAV